MFERWFGTWTDVVAGVAAAAAVAYMVYEVDRRQRKLKDLFYVLDGDDRAVFDRLEEMVQTGRLKPHGEAATA